MPDPAITLRPVARSDRNQALAILDEAFRNDPAIQWCLHVDRPGFQDRLTNYLAWEHDWHVDAQQPVQGAFMRKRLVGLGYVIDPGLLIDAHLFGELASGMRAACGEKSARRYAWLNNEIEHLFPDGPFHMLGFLAVGSGLRRKGIGSSIVQWTIDRSESHPTSRGLLLVTGNPENLSFYRNLGFMVIGEVTGDKVTEWLFWRPRSIGQ